MSDEEAEFAVLEDTPESEAARFIFNREAVDGFLDKGIGTYRAIEQMILFGFCPPTMKPSDVVFLVEEIKAEEHFSEKTYIPFFSKVVSTVRHELGLDDGEVEEYDDEEQFVPNDEFIKERLSDLQNCDEDGYNFNFVSFVVTNADIVRIPDISKYTALRNIELKTNYIRSLDTFTKLPNLVTLDLTENKVTSISHIKFPTLEYLNLSLNAILFVDFIIAPKLKKLDLSQNKIFFISPRSFVDTPELEELNLSTNALKSIEEHSFTGLKKLKILKLDNNQLEKLDNAFDDGLESLIELDISGNAINNLSPLIKLENLEVLDIHGTEISEIEQLAVLEPIQTIKRLHIYESPIADNEVVRLELIHYFGDIKEIDDNEVTFNEKQESIQLFEEREAAKRRLFEEEEEERRRERRLFEEEEEKRRERRLAEEEEEKAETQEQETEESVPDPQIEPVSEQ